MNDDVTTVGRGEGVTIRIPDRSVSRLHAELVRRGPYVYVSDLGLSATGARAWPTRSLHWGSSAPCPPRTSGYAGPVSRSAHVQLPRRSCGTTSPPSSARRRRSAA